MGKLSGECLTDEVVLERLCVYLRTEALRIILLIPRCSPTHGGMVEELLNERAARRVRRRVVHLFTAVAPLQCIAGATSPRGFFESQRGAAGGPLARTPVRLKPCRQKSAFPGFFVVSYNSYEPEG